MIPVQIGQRWASGLAPGCDYATVQKSSFHEGVWYVKFYYITTDGFDGRDTLPIVAFRRAYPFFVEQAFEPFEGEV